MAVACTLAALERALFEASLDRLPAEALEAVLSRLPADSRARAACVSRAWRAAVACPKMWHTLDLTRHAELNRSLSAAVILNARTFAPRLAHVSVLRLSAGPDAPLKALSAVLRLLREKTLSGSLTVHLTDTPDSQAGHISGAP
jgi:hypothetical protein